MAMIGKDLPKGSDIIWNDKSKMDKIDDKSKKNKIDDNSKMDKIIGKSIKQQKKLSLFRDKDKDGIINIFDNKPLKKNKQFNIKRFI